MVVLVVGDAHFWFIFVFCQGDGTSLRILQELVQEIGECLQEVHTCAYVTSPRVRRVNVRFLRVLGRGKRIFKDWVRLIARFYSRSEYDKPLEC